MTECFGVDASSGDEDVLNINTDTDFGTDLKITVANNDKKEIGRAPPSDLRITVDNVPTPPIVPPSSSSAPTAVSLNEFRIPRATRPLSNVRCDQPKTVNYHCSLANPFANRNHQLHRQQQESKNRLTNREKELRRRAFARQHEADQRRQLAQTNNQIDERKREIEQLAQEIESKYRKELDGERGRKRITIEQYRALRDSPPVGRTGEPESLREFANWQREAERVPRPIVLPSQSTVPIEEYVPALVHPPLNATSPPKLLVQRASSSAVQQAHYSVRPPHHIEARNRASSSTSLGLAAVSAVYATTQNQQADQNRSAVSQRHRNIIGAHPIEAATTQQRHSNPSATHTQLSQAIKNSDSAPHEITAPSTAQPHPSKLPDQVVLSRAEYEELKTQSQKKKKLGCAQRKRIRKAIERETLRKFGLLDDKPNI